MKKGVKAVATAMAVRRARRMVVPIVILSILLFGIIGFAALALLVLSMPEDFTFASLTPDMLFYQFTTGFTPTVKTVTMVCSIVVGLICAAFIVLGAIFNKKKIVFPIIAAVFAFACALCTQLAANNFITSVKSIYDFMYEFVDSGELAVENLTGMIGMSVYSMVISAAIILVAVYLFKESKTVRAKALPLIGGILLIFKMFIPFVNLLGFIRPLTESDHIWYSVINYLTLLLPIGFLFISSMVTMKNPLPVEETEAPALESAEELPALEAPAEEATEEAAATEEAPVEECEEALAEEVEAAETEEAPAEEAEEAPAIVLAEAIPDAEAVSEPVEAEEAPAAEEEASAEEVVEEVPVEEAEAPAEEAEEEEVGKSFGFRIRFK